MNDERLVCEVEGETLRFHYAHHPETSWNVRLVDGTTLRHVYIVERPLTQEEAGALVDAHLATMYAPREFEIDRPGVDGDLVAIVSWLVLGFMLGALVFSVIH